MSDSESDIEIKSALHRMEKKKTPQTRSPSDDTKTKKITTKMMITDALLELKTRKGVSLYAIKKFLNEKYDVNTEKLNFLIKKSIKAGVEDGSFVQMKGVGASGSFKLANVKTKPKSKKKQEPVKEKSVKIEKKTEKPKKDKKLIKVKKPEIKKTAEETDEKKPTKKKEKAEKMSNKSDVKPKKSKVKMAKGTQTPAKKRAAMTKRKSIGSIIKPPKMKPKSKA